MLSSSPFFTHQGHEAPWKRLTTQVREGRLPHAMLFVGPEGVGKTTVALDLAVLLQVLKGTVPNEASIETPEPMREAQLLRRGLDADTILMLKGEDSKLPIETIRSLVARVHEGHERPYLIVVLEDLGRLSVEAMNLLLKPLEEPLPDVHFILTANREEDVLPTIRSRCPVLRFALLEEADLSPLLHSWQEALSEAQTKTASETTLSAELLTLAAGRPGRLHQLLQHPEVLAAYQTLEKDLQNFWSRPGISQAFKLAERYESDPLRDALLDTTLVHARTWLLNPMAVPAALAALRSSGEARALWCERVGTAQHDLEANVNARLTLETLFLSIL